MDFPELINRGVHHLSTNHTFTEDQKYFLSLGLNFIPPLESPKQLALEILDSHTQYARSLRLKKHYARVEDNFSPLSVPNPDYQPPTAPAHFESYIAETWTQLLCELRLNIRHIATPYQSPAAQWYKRTLASIKAIPNLTIKPSDKGGETVTLDTELYNDMCMQHLSDTTTYRHLEHPPDFNAIWRSLSALLQRHNHNDAKSSIRKYLFQLYGHKDLRAARFYCLIKLHKTPVVGRPIASCINTITLHASKYLDYKLQPFLQLIPSFLQSAQQLLVALEEQSFPTNIVLVSADIEALYPNIPIQAGLHALSEQLAHYGMKDNQRNFLVDLASFVLTNNYITFEGEHYLQTSGTAMGTPFAVVFANLFLASLERNLAANTLADPYLFRRYIDDLFLIFSDRDSANSWLTAYQAAYPTINLTFKISEESVNFLDLRIFKGARYRQRLIRKLDTELYASSTHKFLHLPPWSHHAKHTFSAFILAERKRIRLNCSRDADFAHWDKKYRRQLLNRGHADDQLEPLFLPELSRNQLLLKAVAALQRYKDRKSAQLNPGLKPIRAINPLVFKVTYSSLSRRLHLRKILELSQHVAEDADSPLIFTPRCPIMCYKRNTNLGELLSQNASHNTDDNDDNNNSTYPMGMGTQPPIPYGYGGGFAPPTTAASPEASSSQWSALLTLGAYSF